jgi:hypothetical protein
MRFKLINGQHADRDEGAGLVDTSALARRARDRSAAPTSSNDDSTQYAPMRPVEARPDGVDEHREASHNRPKVAAGKAINILMKMETIGYCGVETNSVYGAAVAMPQIARSAEWPGTLTTMAIRSYFFLFLNIGLQAFLLSMIGEEQLVMYPFAGQMHLCDFGANIKLCPDAPNCKGPGGTTYTPARLYNYDIWSARIFVRESLKAMFPDRSEEIHEIADPGEYGLENYWCRMACILIFMMAVVDDLRSTWTLAAVLWNVPTAAEDWIKYEPPDWAEDKEYAKSLHGWSELDLVKFQVAGMPLFWKVINAIIVVLPKCILWSSLVISGVHYLMETAGIVDVVVNAMALTFVLDVDEMVFSRLSTNVTKHIMQNLEDLPLFDISQDENEEEHEVLERYEKEEVGPGRWRKVAMVMPKRLLMIVGMQVFFMVIYYNRNCVQQPDGGFVSKEMFLPKDLSYRPLSLMFGIENEGESDAFWTMPS